MESVVKIIHQVGWWGVKLKGGESRGVTLQLSEKWALFEGGRFLSPKCGVKLLWPFLLSFDVVVVVLSAFPTVLRIFFSPLDCWCSCYTRRDKRKMIYGSADNGWEDRCGKTRGKSVWKCNFKLFTIFTTKVFYNILPSVDLVYVNMYNSSESQMPPTWLPQPCHLVTQFATMPSFISFFIFLAKSHLSFFKHSFHNMSCSRRRGGHYLAS